ncbi:type IV pilus assembly protein FimV [Xylophilus ampelinus]|uniref:Tetratricopeptide repeat protein n=1 Tax=Xylophilus ampelinus TaxID=54067 RepID=A0A318SQ46_9BURK|nr:hypothetical protein [Xylophilus ampelinus]MCS4508858.1 hypothetical protein [Xylophilus ampelinus]PYE79429.1 hypothetical protein DFQ15_102162 [Xylophilus ampelinus]
MTSSKTAFGIALLAAASAGHALSLGSPQGAAVVGHPLQLTFDLTLDGPSDGGSSCAHAELFYGETRVDPSRVQIATLPGAQPSQVRIQLASAIAVNEPVVSVNLRAGCGQGLARRYVLLASPPTAQADPAPAIVLPGRPVAEPPRRGDGTALPPIASADKGSASRTPPPSASGRSAPAASTARPAAASRPTAPRRPDAAPARKAPAPGVPRLELQSPTEWLEEHDLPLRPSFDMIAPAATVTPEQRAMAAAAWRRLFAEASPETTAPAEAEQNRNAQTLQDQVKTLQDNAARDRAREAEWQARVDEAERERQHYLWGALGALALLVAALVFFLFGRGGNRDASGAVWWRPRQPEGSAPVAPFFQDSVLEPIPVVAPPAPVARPAAAPVARAPQDLPQRAAPVAPAPAAASVVAAEIVPAQPIFDAAPAATGSSSAAAAAAAHGLRQLDTDALLDVQQNAEFYVSLGQYEQAIALLESYIAAHPGVNPAVYLDLLKILHTLSLTDAYRKLRDEFNASFNADVPVFAGFLKSRRRLEEYPEALARIEVHWEHEDILDVLEDYLFRKPGHLPAAPFELEAYRELLLLHAVARIAIQRDPTSRQGGKARGASVVTGGAGAAASGVSSAGISAASLESELAPASPPDTPPSDALNDYRPSFSLEELRKDQDVEGIGLEPLIGFDMPAEPPSAPDARAAAVPAGFGPAPRTDDNLIDFDLLDLEALDKGRAPESDS